MSKDASDGVGGPGRLLEPSFRRATRGLSIGGRPYPYPEAGRAGDRAGQPHPGPPAPGPGTAFGPARRQRGSTNIEVRTYVKDVC